MEVAGIMGINGLKSKVQDNGNYLIAGSNKSTIGLVFIYNDTGEFGLYACAFKNGAKTSSKISGDLDILSINEYGSVVAPNATNFSYIYIEHSL